MRFRKLEFNLINNVERIDRLHKKTALPILKRGFNTVERFDQENQLHNAYITFNDTNMSEQFKPNQKKSIPVKNLIGFIIGWLFCAGILAGLLLMDKADIWDLYMWWFGVILLAFAVLFIPFKIWQMQKDYRNGRSR